MNDLSSWIANASMRSVTNDFDETLLDKLNERSKFADDMTMSGACYKIGVQI